MAACLFGRLLVSAHMGEKKLTLAELEEFWQAHEAQLFKSIERALKQALAEALSADEAPEKPADPIPYQAIVDLYHAILPFGSACRKLTGKRKAAIVARWKSGDLPDLDTWREYFERAAKSKFIRGEVAPSIGHQQFRASIDFLIREDSYAKALENTGAFKW